MKILQTKISTPIAYTLIVFLIASVALVFYGQFSQINFENINNTNENLQVNTPIKAETTTTPATDVVPTVDTPDPTVPVSEPIPTDVAPTDAPSMIPSSTMPVAN